MKYPVVFVVLLGVTLALAQQQRAPEILFQSVRDFLKLPPDIHLGEVAGVAVNSKGHVFVLSRGNSTGPAYRASAAQLLEFDPQGNFQREIGHNLYAWSYAHSVKIDAQDNIWVADKGSDMVIKFTPEGRVAMVFGRKQEASDEETGPVKHPKPPLPPVDGMFRQVTDMAWDSAGNTYIGDGYINSRIAKVDKNGDWIKSWGGPGSEPGQFSTPHSITLDAEDHVYVADRANRRIQVFDTEGQFCGRSRSMLGSIPMLDRRSATNRSCRLAVRKTWHPARPGRFASRLRRIKFSTAPMATRDGSTNSTWTERFSGCSASQVSS